MDVIGRSAFPTTQMAADRLAYVEARLAEAERIIRSLHDGLKRDGWDMSNSDTSVFLAEVTHE